jgi:thioredoxin-dependent peroxiredoxin
LLRGDRCTIVTIEGEQSMPSTRVADFSAPATSGTTFTLSAHKGQPVVVYFYPKDNTPGCTTEGEQFRDLHGAFRKQGAVVVGVSRDSINSHESFKAKKEFPFELISDADEALCKALDVIRMKNMYGKQVRGIERSTFLIGPDGTLVREWRKVKVDGHAQDVLDAVKALKTATR